MCIDIDENLVVSSMLEKYILYPEPLAHRYSNYDLIKCELVDLTDR